MSRETRVSGGGVRVEVDADVCLGIGQCEALAPELFTFDPDAGISRATSQPGDAEAVVTAREAEDACPTGAVRVIEDAS